MGAYYYRPIDPGYGAVGAGLAAGVEQGASAYFRERELGRQRDDRRAQQDLLLDMEFARQGGARGEIPMQPTMTAPGARGPAMALLPRDEAAGGIPGESAMFQGPGVRMPGLTSTPRQAPGFLPVGSGRTRGYVRDPLVAEEETYQRGVGRSLDEHRTARETARTEAGAAAAALGPAGATLAANWGHPEAQGFAEAATKWWEYGKDPSEFYTPRPPIRGSKEALDILDAEQGVYDRHQNPLTGGGGVTPSVQLRERLSRLETIQGRLSALAAPGWRTPDQLRQAKAEMLRDMNMTAESYAAEWDAVNKELGMAPAPPRAPDAAPTEPWYRQRQPGGRSRPPAPLLLDPGAEEEAPAASVPAEGLTVITQDQADYLREVQGLTDEQINARYRVR